MAVERPLKRAVAAGEILTADMVDVDENSALWKLRTEQDQPN